MTTGRCQTFIRTGLPDDVYCGKPALFLVGDRRVCRRHLTLEVADLSLDGPVVVTRIAPEPHTA